VSAHAEQQNPNDKGQTPLQRQFWTNKKVTEFGASTTTQAAFQIGQRNRRLAAVIAGENADKRFTGW
jgi:hypothetical protein